MSGEDTEVQAKIMGKVIDEKGRPVGGATITCNGEETRTLFDGTFIFEDLAPCGHTVMTTQEGYRSQKIQVQVGEGEEAILELKLEPEGGASKIFGYVLEEMTGEPVKTGGNVVMYRLTKNRNTPIDPETGYYEFKDLPSGTYTIWTSILDRDDERKTVSVREGEECREDFTVRKADLEPPLG
jgi:hypothetical protein